MENFGFVNEEKHAVWTEDPNWRNEETNERILEMIAREKHYQPDPNFLNYHKNLNEKY